MKVLQCSLIALLVGIASQGLADSPQSITVPMYTTTDQGTGPSVGNIIIRTSPYGLIFTPDLKGLSVSPHGFHIHTTPSCSMNGMAANGHLDPENSKQHLGPYGTGHLGDLPALYVNQDGTSTIPVLAPRIKSLSLVKNHALMIHEGGDNYSDEPPLGGGGARMICGVIPD